MNIRIHGNKILTVLVGISVCLVWTGLAQAQIPTIDLEMWLKADAGVMADDGSGGVGGPAADGDPVRQWQDQSGKSNHANQATGNKQPIFHTGVIGTQPGLTFDGVTSSDNGDQLELPNLSSALGDSVTMFVVFESAQAQDPASQLFVAVETSFALGTTSSGETLWSGDSSSKDTFGTANYNASAQNIGALLISSESAGEATFFWNGSQESVVGSNYFGSPGFFVSGRTTINSALFKGEMGEIIIYDRLLSETEHQQVGYYLQEKYGVAGNYSDPSIVPGDANRDGYVDVSDLGILATNYDQGSGFGWEQADFTGDGYVDVSDLGILATNYGATPDAQSVPEPSSLALLSCGLLGLLFRRRSTN